MSLYTVRHGTGWKYKRAVPKDLRATIGKQTWIKTLGSVGHPAAKIEGLQLALAHDRLIAHLRKLAPAERAEIAANGGLQSYLASAETTARDAEIAALFIDALGSKEIDPRRPEAERALDAMAIMDARHEAQEARQEAHTARKALARLGNGKKAGSTVESLVSVWQRVSQPRAPKTIETMERYARHFVGVVGDMEPRAVTRQHVMTFRDALEASAKLSSRSAGLQLDALHRLFNVALSEGLVSANPVHGVKIRKATGGKFSDDASKKPFQPAQVRAIFTTMFSESEDFHWMVRLLAYHGARSGEIVQLQTDDVTELFGVTVIRIHDQHGRVKNRHSIRDIPLHPACVGIVDYAKAAEGPWLFGSFTDTWKSGRAGQFQKLASRFLRKRVGIADRALSMHSLRHTWRTIARELNMPGAVSRAILGHSQGKDDHEGYGGVPSLKLRAEWMAKISPLAG